MSRTGRASQGPRLFPWGALAAIAACCLAAGCATSGAAPWPAQASGPVTVTILSGTDTSTPLAGTHEPGMYSDLVDWWNRYEEPTTNIHVVLDTVSGAGGATDEHSEMLADAERGDSAYDIYNLDNEWVPEFAAGGFIWSLEGHLTDTSGFLAQPLASGTYDGQLYAAPFTTDVGLLYYRSDLVSRDQVTALRSFSQLISLSETTMAKHPQLTIGYAGQFADYEGLTVNLLEIAHGDDPGMLTGNGTISGPGGFTQALTELSDIMTPGTVGVLPSSELNYNEAMAVTSFADGSALFMRNWPIYYEQIKDGTVGKGADQVAGNLAVAPLPFPSVLGGQDLAIAKASRHPDAALKVIEFLTSPAAERCLFAVGGFPATRGSAYSTGDALPSAPAADQRLCGTQAGPEVSIGPVIKQAITDAFLRPRTPYYTEFSSIIQDEAYRQLAGSNPTNDISGFAAGLTAALNAAATTGQAPP
jgi:multiple sugar transport system substrate-binding protein